MDSIIFDVDGTLWDYADSVAAAWNLAIKKFSSLDITLDREILGSVFGKTMTDIGDILFPSLSETEKDSLLSPHFPKRKKILCFPPAVSSKTII